MTGTKIVNGNILTAEIVTYRGSQGVRVRGGRGGKYSCEKEYKDARDFQNALEFAEAEVLEKLAESGFEQKTTLLSEFGYC